jgi:hypothetical protein
VFLVLCGYDCVYVLCYIYKSILNFVRQNFSSLMYCISIGNLNEGPNIRQINKLKIYFFPSVEFVALENT